MDRLELVELIESEKAKLSPEGRELWTEFDASLYLSPEEETQLKAHEKDTIYRMTELSQFDQHVIDRLTRLRAGLYDSDFAECRGEPGEPKRNRSVIHAAMTKDRNEGRQLDPSMSLEQAKARLQEDG